MPVRSPVCPSVSDMAFTHYNPTNQRTRQRPCLADNGALGTKPLLYQNYMHVTNSSLSLTVPKLYIFYNSGKSHASFHKRDSNQRDLGGALSTRLNGKQRAAFDSFYRIVSFKYFQNVV